MSGSGGLLLVPHGLAAREALAVVVAELQSDDPLAPVTVAVPSTYAALSLRRGLGAQRGFVNVRFLALARVAELLGAPFLAEPNRRPLTPALALGAIRTALAEDPGDFGPVARHPATVRSLASTFAELRELDDDALSRLATGGGRAPTVVRLYRRVRDLTRDYYDDEDQLAAATAVVASDGRGLTDIGTLVLHLPQALSPAGVAFVAAFGERGRARAVLGFTGDPVVDAGTHALAARLTPALGPPQPPPSGPPMHPPFGSVVVSCPDADEEVRTVVRDVLARVEAGTPLHRMAVTYRLSEPYARLLHEHFDAAGIPAHGPSPRRLRDTAAGRALLGLLMLEGTGFRRDAVMEVLTSAPLIERAGGKRVPGPRWDRLSCAANIVGGLDEWRLRLERHAADRRALLERRAQADGALFAIDAPDRVLDDCERLTAFVTDLAAQLTPPGGADWRALSDWAVQLLERYVGRTLPAAAPDAEQVALDRVRAVVEGLAGLDALDAPASAAALRAALEEELDVSVGHTGTFGDGVLIAPVGAVLGTDYAALFVVGMSEGTFPPPARDDPVLPDAERDRVDSALARRPERRLQERAAFLAALASGAWRALSYARADTRAQRAVRPAAWLLETAAAHADRLVAAHELEPATEAASEAIGAGWLRIVASFDDAVRATATPASLQEHDVQSLLRTNGSRLRHPLVRAEPRLGAGLRCVRARTSRHLDTWDGVVDTRFVKVPGEDAVLSPTALETWAHCPFRYLLGRVLRVEALERPEARDRISPRHRGTLIHEVLEVFLTAHPRESPEQPWSPSERAELRAMAEAVCDSFERLGLTGRPVLWTLDRSRILRELDRVLDTDESVRASRGLVPHAMELGFGNPDDELPPVRFELSTGVSVAFRGRIDRVDRDRDGHLEVFDYKTGNANITSDDLLADPVDGGTRLQLALYALAVREGEPDRPVRASYWFTRSAGDAAVQGFELDADAEERVRFVLDLVAEEITEGHFPAYPGVDNYMFGPDSCRYCDYDRLCPRDRVRRFERRREDPALDGILSLREPSDDDEVAEDPS
ncbi:MAG: PD-(D/E)XK nuclease family protein [Acidimicrobiia bacterium]